MLIPPAFSQSSFTPGEFFIVGMGTAPDLITLRAQNSIARADTLLAEAGAVAQIWPSFAAGKELWEYLLNFRKFYGADPNSLPDSTQRADARKLEPLRHNLATRIATAVRAGETVANLQSGNPMMYGLPVSLVGLSLTPPAFPYLPQHLLN